VDREFIRRVVRIVKKIIPSWKCREMAQVIIMACLLVVRTWMSIWLADVNGRVVKAIINKDLNLFIKRIFQLFLFALPSSSVNSGIDYMQKMLSLSFRERLTKHFHDQYLIKMHYYQICNLDNRINNPDQRLTNDTQKWADSMASLYLNLSKPILDIILYCKKLAEVVGWQGPAMSVVWYLISGVILRKISPSFGKLTAIE